MTRWPDGSTTKQPKVSSGFGPRKSVKLPNGSWSTTNHLGADFVGFSKVKAVRGGVVTLASKDFSGYGGTVIVRFTAQSGSLVDILYGHLSSLAVKKGQTIDEGDDIGVMGDTGNASGKNLHLEVRYRSGASLSHRDPVAWIGKLVKGSTSAPRPSIALPATVRLGSRGAVVRKLQKLLVKRNHPMPVDGIFGPRTKEVVLAVQRRHGLVADGVVGPKTWKVLLS